MIYDFTTLPDRWDAGAFKYEHMKKQKPDVSRDAVPLSVADMEFLDPPEVVAGLKDYLDHNVLGYTGPTAGYFEAVQSWMERRHGFRPEKDWFITSPGIVPALYEIVKALTAPGDGVLMLSPVYHPFRFAAQEQGREAIFCPLIERERTYDIDFDLFEKLCAEPKVKLFLLCSPHNPVGRIWTRAELLRLAEICLKNGVVMVADEIHGDLILPGYTFVSVGTLPEPYVKNAVLCTAPSKTFNLAGLQNSIAILPDEELRKQYDQLLKDIHIHGGNAMGFIAAAAAYNGGRPWLESILKTVEENDAILRRILAEGLPKAIVSPLEGTYLSWVDLGAYVEAENIKSAMEDKCGLALDYGTQFGGDAPCHIRVNLATSAGIIEKAARLLADNLV